MPRFDDLGAEFTVANDQISAHIFAPPATLIRDQIERVINTVNKMKVIAHKDGALVYNLYNPPQPTRAGLHAVERNIKAKEAGHMWPATANLAITMACQCNCVHCSAAPFKDRKRKELSSDEIKSVVTQATDMGATLVIFVGGDPLLHKDIYNFIKHVDRTKAVPMIFTNGDLLTAENVKKLADAGLYSMNISIDSPDAAEHDELRGLKGAWEKAIKGGKMALDAGILVGLSTYATGERLNNGKVERLLQFAQKEGFNEVTIFDCIPSGKFLKHQEVILSDEDKARVVELALHYHNMSHPMGVVAQAIVNSPLGAGCFGAYSELYMTPYGDIAPCDFNPISFGNVRENKLADIWTRMVSHPDFCRKHPTCRMQTPAYRKRYIDFLPDDIKLPVAIEEVERLRAAKA
jgi:MoaA/NifB/PqqE/SkfB family radical SAM enzyme